MGVANGEGGPVRARWTAAGRMWALLCGGLWAAGCTTINTGALGGPPDSDDARDGGSGGAGGGAGAGGPDDLRDGCSPAPPDSPDCVQVCPELCNGLDDDCDGMADEAEADADCDAAHATGACFEAACVLLRCDDGYGDCDQRLDTGCEVQLATSPAHCGGCGVTCEYDNAVPACMDGICLPAGCVEPFLDCDGDPTDCEVPGDTADDCGACGQACTAAPNATAGCNAGSCGIGQCVGNFGDCNGDPADGCELALTAQDNCGGCGAVCQDPGGEAQCFDTGQCLTTACDAGFDDCDGSPSTACDPLDTTEDCGACGRGCAPGTLLHATAAACAQGLCVATCEAGFGDCDGVDNGCETGLASLDNCGACGSPCAPAQAVGDCGDGGCQIGQCLAGWADCDGDPENGCEANTGRPDNCGGCGIECPAMVGCAMGVCTGITCAEERANCDGLDTCDADLSSDDTCGACDVRCAFDAGADGHGSVACTATDSTPGSKAWACIPSCDAGYADCDGDYLNGCETDLATLDDCGACALQCDRPHGAADCGDGQCGVSGCDQDWDDCDGDGLSCETQLDNAQHCGGCGQVCTLAHAVATCGGSPGARACEVGSCDAGFVDCNGDAADGCELDTAKDGPCCDAMADADGDGVNDCDDLCPGAPDTDADGDGLVACVDACPFDASNTNPGDCFQDPISNLAPGAVDVNIGSDTVLDCGGTITVDTTAGAVSITGWCGGAPPVQTASQPGGPDVLVIAVGELHLAGNTSMRVVGNRPLILIAKGSVTLDGSIDAGASGTTPGAGGNVSCGAATGGNGSGSSSSGGGGGGGGGFGSQGGSGGTGDGASAGGRGQTRGNAGLVPLVGGCGGGKGGGCSGNTPAAGGGAMQVSASGALSVGGQIRSRGGVGSETCGSEGGGTGGGSGGAILLEGRTLDVGGTLDARGGAGGRGRNGGSGGAGATGAGQNGSGGQSHGSNGGGAGGGGYGRIALKPGG